MSAMAVKMDQYDVPFCNSFRPRIIGDQMCYSVDPNEYKDEIDLEGDISLSLFIHYNEDRQMEDVDNSEVHYIIVETIGKSIMSVLKTKPSMLLRTLGPPKTVKSYVICCKL